MKTTTLAGYRIQPDTGCPIRFEGIIIGYAKSDPEPSRNHRQTELILYRTWNDHLVCEKVVHMDGRDPDCDKKRTAGLFYPDNYAAVKAFFGNSSLAFKLYDSAGIEYEARPDDEYDFNQDPGWD